MQASGARPVSHTIGKLMMFAGAALATIAIYLFYTHVLVWHRDGAWPVYALQDWFADMRFSDPSAGWPGIQPVIDWVMASSAVGVLSCAALLLLGIGRALAKGYDP